MTPSFGTVLQEFILASGVKKTQLAARLGYDVSYLSRWTNGAKLPSVDNNRDLLATLASCLVEMGGSEGKDALCACLGIPCQESAEAVCERVLSELQSAYERSAQTFANAAASRKTLTQPDNCLLAGAYVNPETVNRYVAEALADHVSGGLTSVEACLMPVNENVRQGTATAYWTNVLSSLPSEAVVRVTMFADVSDPSYHPALYGEIVALLFNLPERIDVHL